MDDVKFEVDEGDARYVLCEAVGRHRASMLVVGSHGYGAVKRYVVQVTFHRGGERIFGILLKAEYIFVFCFLFFWDKTSKLSNSKIQTLNKSENCTPNSSEIE